MFRFRLNLPPWAERKPPYRLLHRRDVELRDLGDVAGALYDADAEAGGAGLQAVVGLHHRGVSDALAGLYLLHMHVRRDEEVTVACGLDDGGDDIVERLLARVAHLEDDLAELSALDPSVLVVVDEACVLDDERRQIAHALGQVLDARLHRLRRRGLLRGVVAGIVGGREVVDAVVSTVVGVEATAIGVVAGHGGLHGTLLLCLPLLHLRAVLPRLGDGVLTLLLTVLLRCRTDSGDRKSVV